MASSQDKAGSQEPAKAAKLLSDIAAVGQEIDLSGLDVVEADEEYLRNTSNQVEALFPSKCLQEKQVYSLAGSYPMTLLDGICCCAGACAGQGGPESRHGDLKPGRSGFRPADLLQPEQAPTGAVLHVLHSPRPVLAPFTQPKLGRFDTPDPVHLPWPF